MLRRLFTTVLFCFNPLAVLAMDGLTATTAFTSIGQASSVTTAGTYFFDLNGQTFSTYVNASGDVQIAIDFGNGSGDLPAGSSLTTNTRGILTPAILAELTNLTEIRITSSSGNVNVTTSNATLLTRVVNSKVLHGGSSDNTFNDDWTGAGSTPFTVNASCNNSANHDLDRSIFHGCGNINAFHWLPRSTRQREIWTNGEVTNATFFQLFVKGEEPANPSFNVIKSATPNTDVSVGQIISYTYTITNNGNVDISDLSLSDDHNGSGTPPMPDANTAVLTDTAPMGDSVNTVTADGDWDVLGPGDVLTIQATYIVTQNDIDSLQ